MKISNETITIIKSFSNINPSIYIAPGSVIKTIPPLANTLTLYAVAKVKEEFPVPFAIYDLPRFLGVLSLFEDPDFDFQEKHVVISKGGNRVKYAYAEPSMIVHPPYNKDIELPTTDIEFSLTSADFDRILKAVSILKAPEIAFAGDGEFLTVSTHNSKNKDYDAFSINVGETGRKFISVYNSEVFKMLSRDYAVAITPRVTQFKSNDVSYMIAASTASRFE